MNWILLFILALPLILSSCQHMGSGDTIAKLRNVQIEIDEAQIEGGLDKAMLSYHRFLEDTPDSTLAPEAIRRLADLKIEKEYGIITEGAQHSTSPEGDKSVSDKMTAPTKASPASTAEGSTVRNKTSFSQYNEDDKTFVDRATQSRPVPDAVPPDLEPIQAAKDLERAGAVEAIDLYNKLLAKYPLYSRNDQVLYQMSRAYEELGRIDEAMTILERLVREYPQSRYIDEVQFRRAEYFFTRRKYLDAEEAYKTIVDLGVGSFYYELALYKLGWTFYKQELYEEAQHNFIALLDHKVSVGYDFEQTEDETERKRTDDTLRVISLGFSNLGGADTVVSYFSRYGKRSYEDKVYSNLAEFYFDKRRYADASATYNRFVSRNPFHKRAPNFHMRIIEILKAGGFPTLVLDAKKAFSKTYGRTAEYWKYFDPEACKDVMDGMKTNLTDLANHYHSAYQKTQKKEEKPAHFKEAFHWYREFLASFPSESESPEINYQLADLLLENQNYRQAAVEYKRIAYNYPSHEKSSEAGYAAVYALRKQLEVDKSDDRRTLIQEVVRISIKFVDHFPQHVKAAIVLGAAAEDLYAMMDFEGALSAGTRLIVYYPFAEEEIVRTAWLIRAHSAYELKKFEEAELAYIKVLDLLPDNDKGRADIVENLAASIYKQGELANAIEDYRTAAGHFLRVSRVAPTSTIKANAEYDGAVALTQLKEWNQAATVLKNFRNNFPGHELQPEVTKKIAYVYKENGQLSLSAKEYERIETESTDDNIRRDALQVAADLYAQDGDSISALEVYRRYVDYFPQPVEVNLETRNNIAEILKEQNDKHAYLKVLKDMVTVEAAAGSDRTPRTRYLAGKAALVLAEKTYENFVAINLVQPFKTNLRKKQALMKMAIKEFNGLMDYEMGDVTAAAIFYLAEIYWHFCNALMASERPENLSPLELEQYELAIEEQAYPFEEKAIEVHESNLELISRGVYNDWLDQSLKKLAILVPVRYDKREEASGIISTLETYVFALASPAAPNLANARDSVAAVQVEQPLQSGDTNPVKELQPKESVLTAEPDQTSGSLTGQGVQAGLDQAAVKNQAEDVPQIAEPSAQTTVPPEPPIPSGEMEPIGEVRAIESVPLAEPNPTADRETGQEAPAGRDQAAEKNQAEDVPQIAEPAAVTTVPPKPPAPSSEKEPIEDVQTMESVPPAESSSAAGSQANQGAPAAKNLDEDVAQASEQAEETLVQVLPATPTVSNEPTVETEAGVPAPVDSAWIEPNNSAVSESDNQSGPQDAKIP